MADCPDPDRSQIDVRDPKAMRALANPLRLRILGLLRRRRPALGRRAERAGGCRARLGELPPDDAREVRLRRGGARARTRRPGALVARRPFGDPLRAERDAGRPGERRRRPGHAADLPAGPPHRAAGVPRRRAVAADGVGQGGDRRRHHRLPHRRRAAAAQRRGQRARREVGRLQGRRRGPASRPSASSTRRSASHDASTLPRRRPAPRAPRSACSPPTASRAPATRSRRSPCRSTCCR